ncbi:hypothetical protein BJ912DRAFT_1103399 [Pholiota molesta]|nr:hypothetical protein BJ912DRAFT_1103399 [Pholiota molesta]
MRNWHAALQLRTSVQFVGACSHPDGIVRRWRMASSVFMVKSEVQPSTDGGRRLLPREEAFVSNHLPHTTRLLAYSTTAQRSRKFLNTRHGIDYYALPCAAFAPDNDASTQVLTRPICIVLNSRWYLHPSNSSRLSIQLTQPSAFDSNQRDQLSISFVSHFHHRPRQHPLPTSRSPLAQWRCGDVRYMLHAPLPLGADCVYSPTAFTAAQLPR